MSRAVPYRLWVRRETFPGSGIYTAVARNGRQYMVEWTAADSTDLTAPIVPVDVTYTAQAGTGMPGTRGWKEHLAGLPLAAVRKCSLDLAQLPSALAGYIAKPRVTSGGTITIGSYSRTFDTSNLVAVYSDRDKTAGDVTTLEGLYVQRTGLEHSGTVRKHGDGSVAVIMDIELVDVMAWIYETMRSADVEAHVLVNQTLLGPYRWTYQDVWGVSPRTYTVRHGDAPTLSNYREYSFHSLSDVFDSLAEVGAMIFREVARRRAPTWDVDVSIRSSAGLSAEYNHTRAHWGLYPSTHTTAWAAGATAVGVGDRLVCTRIAMHDTPDVSFHGFLHQKTEDDEREDMLASWPTVWDWMVDECAAAVTKTMPNALDVASTWVLSIRCARLREAHVDDMNDPAPLAIGPDDFLGREIDYEIGVVALSTASASVPAATSNDAEGRTVTELWGAQNDREWACPRGFHSLPIAWPDGDRRYNADNVFGGEAFNLDLITQAFNCLTLYHISNAGGLLSSAGPVRIHASCELDDGLTVWDQTPPSVTLPAPNPILEEWEDDDPGGGDTAFGTPYLVCVAEAQRSIGQPNLAAGVVAITFGHPQTTVYGGQVPILSCPGEQLGNKLAAATFPDGNVLLNGGTYLGDLPGTPYIQSIDDDLLGDQLATLTLLGLYGG